MEKISKDTKVKQFIAETITLGKKNKTQQIDEIFVQLVEKTYHNEKINTPEFWTIHQSESLVL